MRGKEREGQRERERKKERGRERESERARERERGLTAIQFFCITIDWVLKQSGALYS